MVRRITNLWQMEDDEVLDANAVNVSTQTAEDIEEVSDNITQSDGADSTIAELTEAADTVEQVADDGDRAEMYMNYIRRKGPTQALFMLDHDQFVLSSVAHSRGVNTTIRPNNDPRSPTAMACLEGLGDGVKKVWEWIKKMCRKIWDSLKMLWERFMLLFKKGKEKVQRVRNILKNRTDRDDDDVGTASTWDQDSEFDKYTKYATNLAKINEAITNDGELANALTGTGDGDQFKVQINNKDESAFIDEMTSFDDDVSGYTFTWDKDEAKNAKTRAGDHLNKAEKIFEDAKKQETEKNKMQNKIKKLENKANEWERKKGTPKESDATKLEYKELPANYDSQHGVKNYNQLGKLYRTGAKVVSKGVATWAKQIKLAERGGNAHIKSAVSLITNGTKTSS